MKLLLPLLVLLALGARALEAAALPGAEEPPGAAGAGAGAAGAAGSPAQQLEAQVEAALDALELHLQALGDYMDKELPSRLQAQEMKEQAKAYLERAGQHLAPLASQLRSSVFSFFSQLLAPPKEAPAQQP